MLKKILHEILETIGMIDKSLELEFKEAVEIKDIYESIEELGLEDAEIVTFMDELQYGKDKDISMLISKIDMRFQRYDCCIEDVRGQVKRAIENLLKKSSKLL